MDNVSKREAIRPVSATYEIGPLPELRLPAEARTRSGVMEVVEASWAPVEAARSTVRARPR